MISIGVRCSDAPDSLCIEGGLGILRFLGTLRSLRGAKDFKDIRDTKETKNFRDAMFPKIHRTSGAFN
jgi:hypothetical protein